MRLLMATFTATAPVRSWLLLMVPSMTGLDQWCLFCNAQRQRLPRLQTGGTPPAFHGGDVRHRLDVSVSVQKRPRPPAHSGLWTIRQVSL
jgi:hypothetical protein